MKEVLLVDYKGFKNLNTDEKVAFANKRLAELKAQGLTTKKFRDNDTYNMSWDFVRDNLKPLGYVLNEKQYALILKENTEQQTNEVAPMEFSAEEIKLLKEILEERKAKEGSNSFEDIVKEMANQKLKPTSVKLRENVADDWAKFVEGWSFYNSSDLFSAALVHFMNSFSREK